MHPHPNQPGLSSNLAGVDKQINNINQLFTRGDHNIGNNDKLFARVAIFNYDFPTIPINYFSPVNSRITARNAVISETHIFSPTLINEAKTRLQPELDSSQQSSHEHGLQSRNPSGSTRHPRRVFRPTIGR